MRAPFLDAVTGADTVRLRIGDRELFEVSPETSDALRSLRLRLLDYERSEPPPTGSRSVCRR
jgi:hypothetical protein